MKGETGIRHALDKVASNGEPGSKILIRGSMQKIMPLTSTTPPLPKRKSTNIDTPFKTPDFVGEDEQPFENAISLKDKTDKQVSYDNKGMNAPFVDESGYNDPWAQ
jgi:hypothetical protein